MTESIKIDGGHDNFRVIIPDSVWRDFFAGLALPEHLRTCKASPDLHACQEDVTASRWSYDTAEALLAESKRRTDAPPASKDADAGTEAGGGATVFDGLGPHEVTVENNGLRACLLLEVSRGELVVADRTRPGLRILGRITLEEPSTPQGARVESRCTACGEVIVRDSNGYWCCRTCYPLKEPD